MTNIDLKRAWEVADAMAMDPSINDPAQVSEAASLIRSLCEIVEKLPVTADGVRIIPHANGNHVWWADSFGNVYYNRNVVQGGDDRWYAFCGWMPEWSSMPKVPFDPKYNECRLLSECSSTRDSALAAAGKEKV